MSIQSFPAQFLPTSPLVDPKNGMLNKDVGYPFVLALFNRTGGGTGIVPKVSGSLTATGNSFATALLLANDWNLVDIVPIGTGVKILPLKPGNDIEVANDGVNDLNVYPPTAQAFIDLLGPGVPFVLAPGKLRIFQCWTLTEFKSYGN